MKTQATEIQDEMERLRAANDSIDAQILKLLAERMANAIHIGQLKSKKHLNILQLERWKEVQQNIILLGAEYNLSIPFLLNLYRLIHEESVRLQTNGLETD